MSTLQLIQQAQAQHAEFRRSMDGVEAFSLFDSSDDEPPALHMPFAHVRSAAVVRALTSARSAQGSEPAVKLESAASHAAAAQQSSMPGLEDASGASVSAHPASLLRSAYSSARWTAPPVHPLPCDAATLSPALQQWMEQLRAHVTLIANPARMLRDDADTVWQHVREQGGWTLGECEASASEAAALSPSTAASASLTSSSPSAASSPPLAPPLVHSLMRRYVLGVSSAFFPSASERALDSLTELLAQRIGDMGRRIADKGANEKASRKRSRTEPIAATAAVNAALTDDRARDAARLATLRSRMQVALRGVHAAHEATAARERAARQHEQDEREAMERRRAYERAQAEEAKRAAAIEQAERQRAAANPTHFDVLRLDPTASNAMLNSMPSLVEVDLGL